jgi:hypothetical protein
MKHIQKGTIGKNSSRLLKFLGKYLSVGKIGIFLFVFCTPLVYSMDLIG